MDVDKCFSNGGWSVNVRTVGDAIKELSLLDPALPLDQGHNEQGCDLVVFNRHKKDIHISFEDGGDWDENMK